MDNNSIAYIIVGAVSLLFGWLIKKNKAPKFLRDWLDKCDADGVSVSEATLNFVREAEAFKDKSGEDKKSYVVDKLTAWASKRLNFPIPRAIVDSVVEYVYQAYKKRV